MTAAVPVSLAVIVMAVPLTATSATSVLLLAAVIAPLPGRVTLTVPEAVSLVRVMLLLSSVRLPAALLIAHEPLQQRIVMNYDLDGMSKEEGRHYIQEKLTVLKRFLRRTHWKRFSMQQMARRAS